MRERSRVSRAVRQGVLVFVVGVIAPAAAGCSSRVAPSPVAPSPAAAGTPAPPPGPAPARVVQLTVTVLQRGSREPLEGATVTTHGEIALTDASGQCWFSVGTQVDTEVRVSAPGYLPMIAGGVLGSDERWTFFLEKPDASN